MSDSAKKSKLSRYCAVAIIAIAISILPRHEISQWHDLLSTEEPSENQHAFRYKLPAELHDVSLGRCSVLVYFNGQVISSRIEDGVEASGLTGPWFSIPAWGKRTATVTVSPGPGKPPSAGSVVPRLHVSRRVGILSDTDLDGRLTAAALVATLAFSAVSLLSALFRKDSNRCARFLVASILAIAAYWLSGKRITVELDRHRLITQSNEKGFVVRLPFNVTRAHLLDRVHLIAGGRVLRFVPQHFWESDTTAQPETWSLFPGNPGSIRFKPGIAATADRLAITCPLLPLPYRDSLVCCIIIAFSGVAIALRQPGCHLLPTTLCATRLPTPPLLLICLLRLWLVSGDDMVALPTMADSYVNHSSLALTGMPIHPPGISLLNALLNSIGVPWRAFLEGAIYAAALFAAKRVKSWTDSSCLALTCFGYLLLHPHSLDVPRFFWSESICLVLHTFLLPIMGTLLVRGSEAATLKEFCSLSAVLVMWNCCRPELPLILGIYICFSACFVAARFWEAEGLRGRWQLLLLPIVLLTIQFQCLRLFHLSRFDIYATDRMHSPSLNALVHSLYRIKEDQRLLYAPVTRHSLSEACRVSPVMARLEADLLRADHPEVLNGERKSGKLGEPGPHLFWLLLTEFSRYGAFQSEQTMRAASAEIDAALGDGRLNARHATYPINPYTEAWTPSLFPIFTSLFLEPLLQEPFDIPRLKDDLSEGLALRFDAVLARRAVSSYRSGVGIRILSQSHFEPGTLVGITAANSNDLLAASVVKSDTSAEFYFRCPLSSMPTEIELHSQKLSDAGNEFLGTLKVDPNARPISRKEFTLISPGTLKSLPAVVETFTSHDARIAEFGQLIFGARWRFFCLTFLSAVCCGLLHQTPQANTTAIGMIGLLSLCYWVGRALFYSLIYCWLGWGPDRYMTTSGPVTLFAAVGFCLMLGNKITKTISFRWRLYA